MSNNASPYIIEARDLVKKFNGFTAVDKISFKVKKGEIFAFLGPNGAGKTTTIKMLTTLLRPSDGSILINSYDPAKEQDKVRSSFGIVFQDQSIDEELTAWENMEFHAVLYGVSKVKRKAKIEKLLRFVGLWEKQKELVKKFSGGMRRRLEIARGLIHEPAILFLDEPTLGLDPQTRANIWDHIKSLNENKGMTVFFTTHYIEEAQKMAHQVSIIDHGKIIKRGTPEELITATNTQNLEEAFLELTGKEIRKEDSVQLDRMAIKRRVRR